MSERKIYHTTVCPIGTETVSEIKKTNKKWGSEHLVKNDTYCVKIMTLESGTKVSLHYHLRKEETFVLLSGKLLVEVVDGSKGENKKIFLQIMGDSLTLKPGTAHTFYCPEGQIEPTVFIEASTQDFIDDSYRIYPSKGKDADSGRSDS